MLKTSDASSVIEINKHFFAAEVLYSVKYIAGNFKISIEDNLTVNYNWRVFANYFLCVEAIKEGNCNNAEDFLRNALVSPEYYNFVTSLIKQIVLVGQTERGGIKSGSTLKTLGCIIISPNTKEELSPVGQYIEDLVHEASHTRLFLEQTKDQLVNNPVVNLYAAPFRKDKRPMSGIYHANYVLGTIVTYFSRAVKATPDDTEIHNDLFLSRAFDRYKETYSIVEQHGELTERGQQIFVEMKTQVDKCLN